LLLAWTAIIDRSNDTENRAFQTDERTKLAEAEQKLGKF